MHVLPALPLPPTDESLDTFLMQVDRHRMNPLIVAAAQEMLHEILREHGYIRTESPYPTDETAWSITIDKVNDLLAIIPSLVADTLESQRYHTQE